MSRPKGPRPIQPYTGRYAPLVALLESTVADTVMLTLSEIEQIIGGPLPTTAQVSAELWRNDVHRYVHEWEAAGWRASFNQRERTVTWRRESQGDAS